MTAEEVFKALLLPPGIIILMLLAACFRVRGGAGRIALFTATATLTLLCLPMVATALMAPLVPYPALDPRIPLAPEVKGILVLGGGVNDDAPEYGGVVLSSSGLRRVRYGAWLHRSTGLPLYVSGGPASAQRPSEADLMARTLRDEFAVPVVGVDNASRTTWENASNSRSMLERDGVSRVLLVSDNWHLRRAVAACERAGIAVIPAPTGFSAGHHGRRGLELADWVPTANALSISAYALHEYLGLVWYQLRGWVQGAAPRVAPGAGTVEPSDAPTKSSR